MVSLRAITEANFQAVIDMKRPDGEDYVAPNVYSLAQAWLYRANEDVFPYAVYSDETPVGFLLLEEDLEERQLIVWRIMFPEAWANRGYGTAALRIVLERAARAGKYDRVLLECDPANLRAMHVYDKLGFAPTGEISHGATEMQYILPKMEEQEAFP